MRLMLKRLPRLRSAQLRFVAVKSEEQQAAGLVFRTRDLAVRQRTQLINAIRGHLAEYGFLNGLPRFQKARKVSAGPQLGDLEVERAEPGIEAAVAVAIAPGRPVAGSFMAASTDQAVNVGFHDDLQNTLCDCAQKISIPGLRHQFGKR
jgi:hypothetical protein